MKLLKPQWVRHDDKPIFSVDIHQGCLKFATGGQGNDSGRVVIWNLLPILSEKADCDPTVPKVLCQMDSHLACVNCVRWSQNGQMLASGSDDKLVMIWKLSKGSSGVFGTGGITKNPESWKCVSTLRGHAGDVLDLAWSPQDRWLASSSVDNTIIIWDVQSMPTIAAVLKGHTGLVKGVTWDPVGKFLASQSDDRSVKIWKTSDWSCGSTITDPFEECGGTTHILRLSWSPDGQYLVSAHAMNGGGPTAQIIEREGWKCDKDFVGHRKAVTCVRFHNSILQRQAPKTNKAQQYCCLAVGSRDRSLSVWMTALQRPLVVIHDLFEDSVLDLSWGPDKYILLACSGDGTVACLQFTEKELGIPLSEEDKNSVYQRIYGKIPNADVHGSSGRDMIIENSELLDTIQQKLVPPTLPTVEALAAPLSAIEAESSSQSQPMFTSEDEIKPQPVRAITKQIETRTADGRRRITPMFIPLHQEAGEMNGTPELNSSSRNSNEVNMNKVITGNISKAADTAITLKEQTHLDSRLTKTNVTAPARSSVIKLNSNPSKPANQQSDSKASDPTRINLTSQKGVNELSKCAHDLRVQVQNGSVSTSFGSLAKITCWSLSLNEKLWEIYIGSSVVNFCLSAKYVLICSVDGTLRFLNVRNGISVLPVLHLSTAAIQCSFCPLGKLAGIISECGQLRVWDIQQQTIYISSSCADIFKSGLVVQFTITETGMPLVMFSNGSSYTYSQNMQCWMVLNSKDPIMRHGLQSSIPRDFPKNVRNFPLMSVQAASNISQTNVVDLNSNNWQPGAKLNFIENQIKLCEALNSPEELKYWYSMLAYHLTSHGTEKRVRFLLDDLLGTTGACSEAGSRKTLNIKNHVLLETVLNTFRLAPRWQRIYMEYNEMLKVINSRSGKE